MYSNNDYILQQAGLIQNGDINTGIHDSLLRNATLIRGRQEYRPIWSYWKGKRPFSWATRLINKRNLRDRQMIRKRIQKHYQPASTIPGN
jgi:hypothetical protein